MFQGVESATLAWAIISTIFNFLLILVVASYHGRMKQKEIELKEKDSMAREKELTQQRMTSYMSTRNLLDSALALLHELRNLVDTPKDDDYIQNMHQLMNRKDKLAREMLGKSILCDDYAAEIQRISKELIEIHEVSKGELDYTSIFDLDLRTRNLVESLEKRADEIRREDES